MLTKLLAAAACMFAISGAIAQPYPSKPVRMIVGVPPGGGTDVVARVISQKRLEGVGTQLREQSAAEFEAYMKAEVAKYAKLIKDTGVKIE